MHLLLAKVMHVLTKAYLQHVIISVSALGIKIYNFLHMEPELTCTFKERYVKCLVVMCWVLCHSLKFLEYICILIIADIA